MTLLIYECYLNAYKYIANIEQNNGSNSSAHISTDIILNHIGGICLIQKLHIVKNT